MSIDDPLKTFYIHVDMTLGALDTPLIVVKFNQPSQLLSIPSRANDLKNALDYLYDTKVYDYYEYLIPPTVTNKEGYLYPCRRALEIAIPEFSLQCGTVPNEIVTTRDTPCSYYYPTRYALEHQSSGLRVAKAIGWCLRKDRITKRLHAAHPQYGWDTNNGAMDRTQALACLRHGVLPNLHHTEALKAVPELWIKEIEKKNMEWLYGQNYALQPPEWWSELFDCGFLDFMSPGIRAQALKTLQATYPSKFKSRFLSNYPPL